MQTLWDLVEQIFPSRSKRRPTIKRKPPVHRPRARQRIPAAEPSAPPQVVPPSGCMQDRYDAVTRQMLAQYNIKVRRWRTAMSGIAWELRYRDGTVKRLIESPKPKGPMSVAIFLHEIGHHAIGFNTYRPRCREEYYAWAYALEQMEKLNLNITDGVRKRMHDSLHYAVQKARRRGLKSIPAELEPFSHGRWKA